MVGTRSTLSSERSYADVTYFSIKGSMSAAGPKWLATWADLFIANLEAYAVFALDLSGTILTWQPGVKQVLGYDREAFIGQPGHHIFTDSDRQAGASEWEISTALEHGQAVNERWHVRADGSRFWGSGMMVALPDAAGNPVGLAKIIRDRTSLWLKNETQNLHALRLEGDVAARTQQVQSLAADLTLAEHHERQRISQLLHDELQQQIYALQMVLHGAQAQAKRGGQDKLYETLTEALDLTKTGMATTRTLVSELSPAALYQGKCAEALVWLAGHMGSRYNLEVTVECVETCPKLPEVVGVLIFQCVQELLFNVVKHAQAERTEVTLRATPESVRAEVKDDGRGFSPASTPQTAKGNVFGLHSVQRRLEAFGGTMQIDSAPGNGARVTIEVPLT